MNRLNHHDIARTLIEVRDLMQRGLSISANARLDALLDRLSGSMTPDLRRRLDAIRSRT